MKKSIKALGVVAILILTFSFLISCVKLTPASAKQIVWQDKEIYEYEIVQKIKDGDPIKGILTINVEKFNNSKLLIKGKDLGKNSGFLMKQVSILSNGYEKENITFIASDFRPIYSYRQEKLDGKKSSVVIDYRNKKAILTGDKKASKKLPKFEKSPYYDPSSIYDVIRGTRLDALEKGMSLNIISSAGNKITTKKLNVSVQQVIQKSKNPEAFKASVFDKYEINEIVPFSISISQSPLPSGSPIIIYMAKKTISKGIDNITPLAKGIINPIVQIVEGPITYTLRSTNIIK